MYALRLPSCQIEEMRFAELAFMYVNVTLSNVLASMLFVGYGIYECIN